MPSNLVQGARAHDVTIHTDADPTGGAVEFAFVAVGAGTAPSSWTAGTWGTWDATQEKVTATTPTIGADGTVALSAGSYVAYARWTLTGEDPIPVRIEGPPLTVRAG